MTENRSQGTVSRPLSVALILFGAALFLATLHFWRAPPTEGSGIDDPASLAVDTGNKVTIAEPLPDIVSTPETATTEVQSSAFVLSKPLKVVILPARSETPDPAALAAADAVRQATLGALRGVAYIDVVDLSDGDLAAALPPGARPMRENIAGYLAVSSRYAADMVAEVFERSVPDNSEWSIRLFYQWPASFNTSDGRVGISDAASFGDEARSLGAEFAELISRNAIINAQLYQHAAGRRGVLLDATRTEDERSAALVGLADAGLLDGEMLAAAAAFTGSVTSASRRESLWGTLWRSSFDPTLGQSMSYALLSDADAGVRTEVAIGLSGYLADGGIKAALEHASRNDSNDRVRLAARMAMMTADERQTLKRETLLDQSLTPAQRLAPSMFFGGASQTSPSTGFDRGQAEAVLAYAEILREASDPDTWSGAIAGLYLTISRASPFSGSASDVDPMVTRALLVSAEIEDGHVRRVALQALTALVDNPDVRAALEAVLAEQPQLAAELQIAEVLDRQERGVR